MGYQGWNWLLPKSKVQRGIPLVYGVVAMKPMEGFPAGRMRIRMRNTDYVRVFIRPPEGGIRHFAIRENGSGVWVPAVEIGANKTASQNSTGQTPAAKSWLCRIIGHRWITHGQYRVGDMEATRATVWGCCTRCGTPTPTVIERNPANRASSTSAT